MSGNLERGALSLLHSALRLCASAALCLGCSMVPHRLSEVSAPSATALDGDTAIFAAVVRAAARDDPARTRVDPRPLRSDTAVYIPSEWQPVPEGAQRHPSVFASIPEGILQQRRDVIRRLGLQETDAAADMKCPGILTPPSITVDRSACPRVATFLSVVFSLPRRPNARDQIRMDSIGLQQAKTWIVRGSARSMTVQGASTLASDYFMTRSANRRSWIVAKVVGLMWIE